MVGPRFGSRSKAFPANEALSMLVGDTGHPEI